MPARLPFGGDFDVMLPLRIDAARPSVLLPERRGADEARRHAGARPTPTSPACSNLLRHVQARTPNATVRWVPMLVPLKEDVVGDVGQTLWVLMATDGHRAADGVRERRQPAAGPRRGTAAGVRDSRGARRATGREWREQLLVESMLLALIGGVLGLVLAAVGLRLLVAVEPANLPRLSEIAIDPRSPCVALAISCSCGLLFGLIPIVKYCRTAAAGAIDAPRARRQPDARAAAIAARAGRRADGARAGAAGGLRADDPQLPGAPRRRAGLHPAADAADASRSRFRRAVVADPERVTRMQQDDSRPDRRDSRRHSVAFTTRLPMDPTIAGAPRFRRGHAGRSAGRRPTAR